MLSVEARIDLDVYLAFSLDWDGIIQELTNYVKKYIFCSTVHWTQRPSNVEPHPYPFSFWDRVSPSCWSWPQTFSPLTSVSLSSWNYRRVPSCLIKSVAIMQTVVYKVLKCTLIIIHSESYYLVVEGFLHPGVSM